MSTTPTTATEPEDNEMSRVELIRTTALQYASFLCTKESGIKVFLRYAKQIEDFIVDGKSPKEEEK
jgi:hypothetical protein